MDKMCQNAAVMIRLRAVLYIYVYIYIYTQMERGRETGIDIDLDIPASVCVCVCGRAGGKAMLPAQVAARTTIQLAETALEHAKKTAVQGAKLATQAAHCTGLCKKAHPALLA